MRSIIISIVVVFASFQHGEAYGQALQPKAVAPNQPWMLGPFQKTPQPILGPNFATPFRCPMLNKEVHWEARAVIAGCPVVRNDSIHLIYYGEDNSTGLRRHQQGTYGVLRIGYAEGISPTEFIRDSLPVVYPDNDRLAKYEHPRGCEIPRLVEGPDGTYYLYYNGYDGEKARLLVATSRDLRHWTKHGLALHDQEGTPLVDLWSKSGAVVTTLQDGRLIADRINGRYWMYWGERPVQIATSDDLIKWTLLTEKGKPVSAISARPQGPDRDVTEPGVAVRTEDGIVLIYNNFMFGDKGEVITSGLYQALFEADDPTKCIGRSDAPFLIADREFERYGCVNNVVFCTGIMYYQDQWHLYFNGGDWVLCHAIADL